MAQTPTDLSFKVLDLLSKERAAYGLRNGDHVRYRKHCANKLHRLRQVTGLTSGKGKTYKKPAAVTAETVTDVRHLHLLLFSAERALAHSHELKALIAKDPSSRTALRKEQLSWLRRAHKFASTLHSIGSALASSSAASASASVSQRTLADLAIYHLAVRAELAFEKGQWAEALADLAARRRLLGTLAAAAADSYDAALATEFIDAHDARIRYAAYKLGRAESHDIDGVVADVDADMCEDALAGFGALDAALRSETGVDAAEAGRRELDSVAFAGQPVELRHAEMVKAMLRVQAALAQLGDRAADGKSKAKGSRGWDKVLAVLGDAEAVARQLLDAEHARGLGSLRSAKTTAALGLAHQYITYLLLAHRVRRDLALVDSVALDALPADPTDFKIPGGRARVEAAVKSLQAVIKVYDTVLQSLAQARALPAVEDKESVRRGAEDLEAHFYATRCYHLARLHSIHPTPSYASTVQLLARATARVSIARAALFDDAEPVAEPIVTLSPADVDALAAQLAALDAAAKRALFAQTVPKPVFFDTAFNYVEMPMDALLVRAGKKDAKNPTSAGPVADSVKAAKAATGAAVDTAVKAASKVVEQVAGDAQTAVGRTARESREATPGPEVDEGKPKGWLGGWFARK
ncbi:signal recognition particle subunit srp68 [Cryptotrichosporon argae]